MILSTNTNVNRNITSVSLLGELRRVINQANPIYSKAGPFFTRPLVLIGSILLVKHVIRIILALDPFLSYFPPILIIQYECAVLLKLNYGA